MAALYVNDILLLVDGGLLFKLYNNAEVKKKNRIIIHERQKSFISTRLNAGMHYT